LERPLDNYIVRIYRREKDNPRMLVGLVEEVGRAGKKAFSTLDDLWDILNSGKHETGRRREDAAHGKKRIGGPKERRENRIKKRS
jgi:hypothetical protein